MRPEGYNATLSLIFLAKRRDRIILISDSARDAAKRGRPVFDADGNPAGSGVSPAGGASVLKRMGIPGETIQAAGIRNPYRYLRKGSS
ncbi:MAG: hypothetical protein M1497_01785 [Nitrospirae bacterium]|nr:hypothetical protein [Nitrospirota bacterium]